MCIIYDKHNNMSNFARVWYMHYKGLVKGRHVSTLSVKVISNLMYCELHHSAHLELVESSKSVDGRYWQHDLQ